jgi:hypothetical protein
MAAVLFAFACNWSFNLCSVVASSPWSSCPWSNGCGMEGGGNVCCCCCLAGAVAVAYGSGGNGGMEGCGNVCCCCRLAGAVTVAYGSGGNDSRNDSLSLTLRSSRDSVMPLTLLLLLTILGSPLLFVLPLYLDDLLMGPPEPFPEAVPWPVGFRCQSSHFGRPDRGTA